MFLNRVNCDVAVLIKAMYLLGLIHELNLHVYCGKLLKLIRRENNSEQYVRKNPIYGQNKTKYIKLKSVWEGTCGEEGGARD